MTTYTAADPVPSWVHLADVPPPCDDEPWPAYPPERSRRMDVLVAACIAFLAGVGLGTLAARWAR